MHKFVAAATFAVALIPVGALAQTQLERRLAACEGDKKCEWLVRDATDKVACWEKSKSKICWNELQERVAELARDHKGVWNVRAVVSSAQAPDE